MSTTVGNACEKSDTPKIIPQVPQQMTEPQMTEVNYPSEMSIQFLQNTQSGRLDRIAKTIHYLNNHPKVLMDDALYRGKSPELTRFNQAALQWLRQKVDQVIVVEEDSTCSVEMKIYNYPTYVFKGLSLTWTIVEAIERYQRLTYQVNEYIKPNPPSSSPLLITPPKPIT